MTVEVVGVGSAAVAPLSLSEAGSWLCSRHEDLQALVEEIDAWENGAPSLWRVRNVVRDFDMLHHAEDAASSKLYLMSPSQVGRLRLLATLAPRVVNDGPWSGAVSFSVDDLLTFDRAGKELIEDWLRCVRIGVIG